MERQSQRQIQKKIPKNYQTSGWAVRAETETQIKAFQSPCASMTNSLCNRLSLLQILCRVRGLSMNNIKTSLCVNSWAEDDEFSVKNTFSLALFCWSFRYTDVVVVLQFICTTNILWSQLYLYAHNSKCSQTLPKIIKRNKVEKSILKNPIYKVYLKYIRWHKCLVRKKTDATGRHYMTNWNRSSNND